MRKVKHLVNYRETKQFFEDAKVGKLANYSWIDCKYYADMEGPANDQHPDHPVELGEKLMKDVYEAVRNGPKWN